LENFEIFYTSRFQKELKAIIKKHPDFKANFSLFLDSLESQPQQGTPIGKGCYKIRLAVKSKGKGKSGGMRVITFVVTKRKELFLLSIYDKADKDTLSDKEILALIPDLD